MQGVDVRRRSLLFTALSFGVAGCSNSPVVQSTVDALRIAWSGYPDTPLTRERISALPYSTMGVKVGEGPRGMVVLGGIDQDNLHWFSADRVALVTRHGRLVSSVGLAENLVATHEKGPDPLAGGLHRLDAPVQTTRLIDFTPGNHFGVPVHSRFDPVGPKRIEILDLWFDTVLVRETCRAPIVNWEFENFFWVDASNGMVWKSVQFLTPNLPEVHTELFKPPAT